MIFMPPRHGKSELASRRFPAWFLGKNPDRSIIAASYNSELAGDFGREVRNIVAENAYSKLFDVSLASDSKAANRWHTNRKGGYAAAGVGTAVTGRGAHVLLIDDPLKDREEADSETIREKVWRWYTSTAYTRLEGTLTPEDLDDDDIWKGFVDEVEAGDAEPFEGAVVLIQTRWHEDDLGGRLLEAQKTGGDQWDVLSLPAIEGEGTDAEQALWPAKYPLERLKRIKAAITQTSERDWTALYQQQPSPDEGTYFQRDWFDRWDETPKSIHYYIISDYAVTEDGGDWTVHNVWGFNGQDLYQVDMWRGRTSADVWIERLLDLVAMWKPLCAFGEGGVIEKSVRPMLLRRMRERKVHCRMEWIASVKDKPTRARAFQSRAAMGLVHLMPGEKGDETLTELLSFPAGKHDDIVDTCGLMGMVIDEAHPGITVAPPKPKPRDIWDDDSSGDGSWKVS